MLGIVDYGNRGNGFLLVRSTALRREFNLIQSCQCFATILRVSRSLPPLQILYCIIWQWNLAAGTEVRCIRQNITLLRPRPWQILARMAVADHITLSSSPIWHAPCSSPGLPSPSQLFMSKAVRPSSGSAAVPIPQDAYVGSTSTSSLSIQKVRNSANARFILKAKELLESLEQKPPEPAEKDQNDVVPAYQSRVHKSTCTGKLKSPPKLPVINADAKEKEGGCSGGKRRRKQSTKDEQTKIQEAKITKPGVATADAKRRKTKATAIDQALEGSDVEHQRKADTEKDAPASRKEASLGLREALKRRKDWTPRKRPLEHTSQTGETNEIRSIFIPSQSPNADFPDVAFGKLALGFSYAGTTCPTVTNINAFRSASGETGTKRRKLDVSYLPT